MSRNPQTQQNDVEVRFSRQRLRKPPTHRIKRDIYQPHIHALDIRLTQPRRTEVAGQELQQAEVRRDQIINLLLVL